LPPDPIRHTGKNAAEQKHELERSRPSQLTLRGPEVLARLAEVLAHVALASLMRFDCSARPCGDTGSRERRRG
jgi:hypothetical protein